MHLETIKAIAAELAPVLTGRFVGKSLQVTDHTLVLDFGLVKGEQLLLSADPASPRFYLIRRRLRDLDKQAIAPSPFLVLLRNELNGVELSSITPDENERVVRMVFSAGKDSIEETQRTVVAQLTGRSANLFLLNEDGQVLGALRNPHGRGQLIGEKYEPPPSPKRQIQKSNLIERGDFPSLSAALDSHFSKLEKEQAFAARIKTAHDRLKQKLARVEKLQKNLQKDLAAHGDPDEHKRFGDLLLANQATAVRSGEKVRLRDYYADGEPEIELQIDEKATLPEAAAKYFSSYAKAKRAKEEIGRRLEELKTESSTLSTQLNALDEAAESKDESALAELIGAPSSSSAQKKKRTAEPKLPGIRRYLSSDGYEVLVGRAAKVNDQLTFKVAKPHDLWLHAADYPGSHVVVRNKGRQEIPHRTIVEAAQLAAQFSQASEDAKVNIHYTQRKFLSKPKGAAAGLVRLSRFKTITVKPGENLERIEK